MNRSKCVVAQHFRVDEVCAQDLVEAFGSHAVFALQRREVGAWLVAADDAVGPRRKRCFVDDAVPPGAVEAALLAVGVGKIW